MSKRRRGLEAVVASKVSTGGSIELMDVVELLKAGQVPIDAVSRGLSGEELARFQDLVRIAELEAAAEGRSPDLVEAAREAQGH